MQSYPNGWYHGKVIPTLILEKLRCASTNIPSNMEVHHRLPTTGSFLLQQGKNRSRNTDGSHDTSTSTILSSYCDVYRSERVYHGYLHTIHCYWTWEQHVARHFTTKHRHPYSTLLRFRMVTEWLSKFNHTIELSFRDSRGIRYTMGI